MTRTGKFFFLPLIFPYFPARSCEAARHCALRRRLAPRVHVSKTWRRCSSSSSTTSIWLKRPTAPRMPLAHCRDPRDPARCKAGFPRSPAQMTETSVLDLQGPRRQKWACRRKERRARWARCTARSTTPISTARTPPCLRPCDATRTCRPHTASRCCQSCTTSVVVTKDCAANHDVASLIRACPGHRSLPKPATPATTS